SVVLRKVEPAKATACFADVSGGDLGFHEVAGFAFLDGEAVAFSGALAGFGGARVWCRRRRLDG
ncbi:MAG: hypothetical protein R3F19_32135, partial [Verrucomicrobiales bacterium]